MKSHLATLLIALAAGFLGGRGSEFFISDLAPESPKKATPEPDQPNPFRAKTDSEIFAVQISAMQQKIDSLEVQLAGFTLQASANSAESEIVLENSPDIPAVQPSATTPQENLVAAGVDPNIADDILKRIGEQQYRSMELQNLMRQGASGDRQRYQEELKELGQQRISLRTELDEDTYDRFLFESGKKNRVKVASVMPGSPAESSGFETDDIILYYGDSRIIEGGDVRKAAWGGDANSYVNVAISRDGNQMMLTVPGGTLGVRLEPIQVDPGQ